MFRNYRGDRGVNANSVCIFMVVVGTISSLYYTNWNKVHKCTKMQPTYISEILPSKTNLYFLKCIFLMLHDNVSYWHNELYKLWWYWCTICQFVHINRSESHYIESLHNVLNCNFSLTTGLLKLLNSEQTSTLVVMYK